MINDVGEDDVDLYDDPKKQEFESSANRKVEAADPKKVNATK